MKVAKAAKYTLKPTACSIVDALQYNIKNKYEVCEFFKGQKFSSTFHEDGMISILIQNGEPEDDDGQLINLLEGDWVSKNQVGEYREWSDVIFKQMYEVSK